MGIIKRLGLTIVGAALKAYDPERFKKIIQKGDGVYDIAVELVKRSQLKPFKTKVFADEEDAKKWVMATHADVCKKHSAGDITIFPTIENSSAVWRASVWVAQDDEILAKINDSTDFSMLTPREGVWLETERFSEELRSTWEVFHRCEVTKKCTLTSEVNTLSCFYDQARQGTFFVMRVLDSSPDRRGISDYCGCFVSDEEPEKASILVERVERDDGTVLELENDVWWDFDDQPYESDDSLTAGFAKIRAFGTANAYSDAPPLFVYHTVQASLILRAREGIEKPLRSRPR